MTRRFPPAAADERTMLTGWLDVQRATVRLKCAGLTDEQAQLAVLPSSPRMTVKTLVAHLRWVELSWFETSFLGARELAVQDPLELPQPPGASLDELLDEYDEQCARSREIVAAHELDELEAWAPEGLDLVSLRWIITHLLEETARHLGHLDALRELTDGITGY
ncbi:DinB family protein [Kribbella sp. NPDC049227]|uniref:DinB family protein n=1 Tax=Kribbella sp. NPDC049227 TaxID=3364113 RepID=UPI003723EC93